MNNPNSFFRRRVNRLGLNRAMPAPLGRRNRRNGRRVNRNLAFRLNQLEMNTASNNYIGNRLGLGMNNVNLGPMRRSNRMPRRITLRRNVRGRNINGQQYLSREFEVTQRESFRDIFAGMNRFDLTPGASGMPMLDGLANLFDNYVLVSAIFEISSGTATTKDGKFHTGIDYQSGRKDMTLAELKSLFMYSTDNVFKTQSQRVFPEKAMKQKLHATATHAREDSGVPTNACTLYVYSDADTTNLVHGEVFVQYTIKFVSPNPPPSAASGGRTASAQTSSTFISGAPSNPQIQPANNMAVNDDEFKTVTILHGNSNILNPDIDGTADAAQFTGLLQNDTFTIATTTPIGQFTADQVKVNFSYSDGTPVEVGAIRPLATPVVKGLNVVGLHELHKARVGDIIDLLATIFQIAKPFLKPLPIIGTILKIVSPDLQAVLDVPEDAIIAPNTTAFGIGEELNITLPDAEYNTLEDLSTSTINFVTQAIVSDTTPTYLSRSVITETDNPLTLTAYFGSPAAVVPFDTASNHGILLPDPYGTQSLNIVIDNEGDTVVEGDVFVAVLETIANESYPATQVLYANDESNTVGFKKITQAGRQFYVALPKTSAERSIAFTTTETMLPGSAGTSIDASYLVKSINFTLTRVGSTLRDDFLVPLQEPVFELEVRANKKKRGGVLV